MFSEVLTIDTEQKEVKGGEIWKGRLFGEVNAKRRVKAVANLECTYSEKFTGSD